MLSLGNWCSQVSKSERERERERERIFTAYETHGLRYKKEKKKRKKLW